MSLGKLGARGGFGSLGAFGGTRKLMLDALSVSPAVAYSTRKLRAAYAGSALRVQRSSDSTQQDIGFTANQLNTTALLSFLAGSTGTVVTWYDQSTNAVNAGVGTGNQPRIATAGVVDTLNGNPAILMGLTMQTNLAFTVSLSQPNTIAIASKLNAKIANAHYTDGTGATRQLIGEDGTATNYQQYAGSGLTGGTLDLLSHAIIGIFNGASSSVVVDGSTIITGNPGSGGMTTQGIGSGQTGAPSINGLIGEYIVFPSVLGAPDQAILRASWQTQWGTQ